MTQIYAKAIEFLAEQRGQSLKRQQDTATLLDFFCLPSESDLNNECESSEFESESESESSESQSLSDDELSGERTSCLRQSVTCG